MTVVRGARRAVARAAAAADRVIVAAFTLFAVACEAIQVQSPRHGIGDALLRSLLDKARQAGYASLSLSVDSQNGGAIRLYERHGFQRTEDDGASVTMVARLA